MAQEITVAANMTANKLGVIIQQARSAYIDMNGTNAISNTQQIGTTAEQINFGDITGVPRMVEIYSTGTNPVLTPNVDLALDSGMTQKFAVISPGEPALFRPATNVIYAKCTLTGQQVVPTVHVTAAEP